jgi:peroxiredoxin
MIEPGTEAPDFTLPDQEGEPVSLSEFRGRPVVLYFYPSAEVIVAALSSSRWQMRSPPPASS